MNNDNKILSIIIPVYNAEKYIERLICNLQDSRYHRLIEVICIDDGSNDSSLKVLAELDKKFLNIKLYHQENQGVSTARNKGLMEASGAFIYFADADDDINIMEFDKVLKKLVQENVDLAVFGITDKFYYGNGKVKTLNNFVCNSNYDEKSFFQDFGRLLNKHILYSPCNKIYKRSIIEDNNIQYDREYAIGEDMLFNLNYFKYIKTIAFYDNYVYMYRHNMKDRQSNSSRYHAEEQKILLTIIESMRKLLISKSALEQNKIWINTFIVSKLSALLNHAYAKNSPLTKEQKISFIDELYLENIIFNAIDDKKIHMGEIDQKILLFLHQHRMKKIIDLLYKTRNMLY